MFHTHAFWRQVKRIIPTLYQSKNRIKNKNKKLHLINYYILIVMITIVTTLFCAQRHLFDHRLIYQKCCLQVNCIHCIFIALNFSCEKCLWGYFFFLAFAVLFVFALVNKRVVICRCCNKLPVHHFLFLWTLWKWKIKAMTNTQYPKGTKFLSTYTDNTRITTIKNEIIFQ